MTIKRILSSNFVLCPLLLMAIFFLSIPWAFAADKAIELKLSHWIPGETEFSKTIFEPVVEYINKNSGGRLHCTLYAGGALGGPGEQYEMVKNGIAEIAYLVPTFEPGVWPLSEMMGMPITFPNNRLAAEATLATYDRILKKEYSDIINFGIYRTGDMYINLTKKKVTKLEGLKGLRIRSTGGMTTLGLRALGVAPIAMAPPDMYLAMERGVVDGACNTYSFMDTYKMYEITKYTVEFGMGTGVCAFIMNKETWNKLPDDLKKVVSDAAKLGTRLNYEYPDNGLKKYRAKMTETGEVYPLSASEQIRWYNVIRPEIHKWASNLDKKGKKGTKTLDIFREECEKRGFDFPY